MEVNSYIYIRTLCTLSPTTHKNILEEQEQEKKDSKYFLLEEQLNNVLDIEKNILKKIQRNAMQMGKLKTKITYLEKKKPKYSKKEAEYYYQVMQLEKKLEKVHRKCTDLSKDPKNKEQLLKLRKAGIKLRDKIVALKTLYSP